MHPSLIAAISVGLKAPTASNCLSVFIKLARRTTSFVAMEIIA